MRQVLFLALLCLAGSGCLGQLEPYEGDDDTTAADDDDIGDDDDSAANPDPYIQPDVYVTPLDLDPGDTATVHYHGEFSDEPSLWIRYGFNGYNRVEELEEYLELYHYGNWDYFFEEEMTAVAGGFEFDLVVPEDARALQFTFFVDDGGDVTYDDNGGWGYHQGLVFPYIGPLLTWNEATAPEDGVVITYETSVPCKGTLEYGTTAALGTTRVGDEVGRLHHVVLTGLEPDTDYYYRVRDSLDHVSETHVFRTAPSSAGSFSFAALADAQDNGDGERRWADVADEVFLQHGDVRFVLFIGDLPTDQVPGDWWTFFDKGRELFASTVVVPAVGNHDTPTDQHDPDAAVFLSYFQLPTSSGGPGVFRVDHGSAALLTLNAEFVGELAVGGDQYQWVQDQITALQGEGHIDWVFAQLHTPPYNAGDRFDINEQATVREVTQLMDGAVDWVLAGHEHLYQRMHPLRYEAEIAASGQYGVDADDGIGYLVLPPAGIDPRNGVRETTSPAAWLRDLVAFPVLDPETAEADSEMGFVIVSIDAQTLTLETYGMGSPEQPVAAYVRDTVTYTK